MLQKKKCMSALPETFKQVNIITFHSMLWVSATFARCLSCVRRLEDRGNWFAVWRWIKTECHVSWWIYILRLSVYICKINEQVFWCEVLEKCQWWAGKTQHCIWKGKHWCVPISEPKAVWKMFYKISETSIINLELEDSGIPMMPNEWIALPAGLWPLTFSVYFHTFKALFVWIKKFKLQLHKKNLPLIHSRNYLEIISI